MGLVFILVIFLGNMVINQICRTIFGVITRQKCSCSLEALTKKGAIIEEIIGKFNEDLKQGNFVPVPEANINQLDCYYLNWFCVIGRTRAPTKNENSFCCICKSPKAIV